MLKEPAGSFDERTSTLASGVGKSPGLLPTSSCRVDAAPFQFAQIVLYVW